MTEFVSEVITAAPGHFDTQAMARGEPGLPVAFCWRDRTFRIRLVLDKWKQSGPEIGRRDGETYLRRHYFKLAMDDDTVWTVYFIRQPRPSRARRSPHIPPKAAKRRWFLYAIDTPTKIEEPT